MTAPRRPAAVVVPFVALSLALTAPSSSTAAPSLPEEAATAPETTRAVSPAVRSRTHAGAAPPHRVYG
ncbi:hypothetical protein ACFUKV_31185 [Streptomyces paradoxus]|uniref:hypothetical protein n=1 Tax=Streptomyces paradoxus TaxID=66375 RepID=UPI003633A56B